MIGAGPGGLVCANRLAMNGLDVTLLEAHDKVGGLAQAWTRRPRLPNGDRVQATFELTHAVAGFHRGGNKDAMLKGLGVDTERIGPYGAAPKLAALRAPGVEPLELLNTLEETKRHLLERFASEAEPIGRFFSILEKIDQERRSDNRRDGWQKSLEKFSNRWVKPQALKIPFLILTKPTIVWRRNQTYKEYMDSCNTSLELQAALSMLFGYVGLPPSAASGLCEAVTLLSYWSSGGPQAPLEGSFQDLHEELARVLVETHGGKVQLRSRVTGIDVDQGKVTGVEVTEQRGAHKRYHLDADLVVMSGDMKRGMLPLSDHLPGDYVRKLQASTMSISLMGLYAIVEMDLSALEDKLGYAANVLASSGSVIDKADAYDFPAEHLLYASVPTVLRPRARLLLDEQGQASSRYHVVNLAMQSPPYEKWKTLRESGGNGYKEEKERYAEQMLAIAERMLIPGLRESVRFKETYTAATMERYCGCTEGAVFTFAPTPKQFIPNRFSARTPIRGLWLGGSTVFSAGVCGAMEGGESAAKQILSA